MVAIGYQSRDRNIFWDVGRSGFSMGCCRVYWHGSSSIRDLVRNIFWVMRQLYFIVGICGFKLLESILVFIPVLVFVFVFIFLFLFVLVFVW